MDEQQEQQVASETTAQEVPVVVDAKPLEPAKVDENSVSSSSLPYHTAATEKIQEERMKEQEDKDPEPFTFEMHGYTVQQRKAEGTEEGFADENGDVFEVTGNDLHRVYGNKRDAVIFVQTTNADFAKTGNIQVI
jgi:hypothetical protein